MIDCHIQVGDSLCLNALSGIHHQQRTLTGCDGARHLVREIHMSRGINQVQDILLTLIHIFHLDGMTLNRNASFTLQIHIIEHLTFSDLNSLCKFQ